MTNKSLRILSIPVILVMIAVGLCFRIVTPQEYLTEFVYKQKYSGRVMSKYLDKNHAYKRIKINLESGVEILGARSWIKLYENCEVGDSIVKESGRGELDLYRHSQLIYTSMFNLNSGNRVLSRFSTFRNIN